MSTNTKQRSPYKILTVDGRPCRRLRKGEIVRETDFEWIGTTDQPADAKIKAGFWGEIKARVGKGPLENYGNHIYRFLEDKA